MNRPLLIKIVVMTALVFLFLAAFCHYVPFNMDEFYQYHPIMEHHYPLSVYNVFMERTSEYDLAFLPDKYLPLRAFHYTGSFPSLLYYPLFAIWKSPCSVRLFGMIMLLIQSLIIFRLFRTDMVFSFLALILWMPYSFSHIADTGPVSFQTTSIFLIAYLTARWAEDPRIKYAVMSGIIIFLGIWTKLTYFFLLPGLAVIICPVVFRAYVQKKAGARTIMSHGAALSLAAAVPSAALLWCSDRNGLPYYLELFKKDFVPQDPSLPKTHFDWVIQYITNPLASANRIFDIKGTVTVTGVILICLLIVFLVYGFHSLLRSKKGVAEPVIYCASFAISFALLFFHPKTWAMHHIVLSYPFLALALFSVWSRISKTNILSALCILFFVLNTSLYSDLTRLSPLPADHPSKIKLNSLLNERYADKYVLVIIDWGLYFIKALYGPLDQCVVYITPFNKPRQAELLKVVLEETGRKAVFVGRSDSESDLTMIRAFFPDIREADTGMNTGKWRIWLEK